MQRQEETINKERGRLLVFIKSKVSNFEDVDDILQDVLEQIIGGYRNIELRKVSPIIELLSR